MEDKTKMIKDFICPVCGAIVEEANNNLLCSNDQCNKNFPIIKGIPVLINENNSVFSIQSFINQETTTFSKKNKFFELIEKLIPSTGINIPVKANYEKFRELITINKTKSKVLIVGGGVIGEGLETILFDESIDFIESDVSFGPRTSIIFDCHNIPFKDKTFDGVIIQAVLEHVADPYCCVEEIHRVLKDDGLVYAETPFMQQVHLGRFDFTRFTHLGHRRLFRKFDEIKSGVACGPAMALAWSYTNFLLCFSTSKVIRKFIQIFARFTSFWLKYLDYYLIKKAGSFDSASGFYFIGKKSNTIISDKEIIKIYKGCK